LSTDLNSLKFRAYARRLPSCLELSLISKTFCFLITLKIYFNVLILLINKQQNLKMSNATAPISPARFAAALKDLPLSTLHLKAAELRNSIAHLDYSNEQLKPFAGGTEPSSNGVPDQDCVDAIRENEVVIERMKERIELLRAEVEGRGSSWTEFSSKEELEEESLVNGMSGVDVGRDGDGEAHGEQRSQAWTDGTFQTGRIINGEGRMDGNSQVNGTANGVGNNVVNGEVSGGGGRLDDQALRRAMDERMRALAEEGNEDEGMHL